MPVVIVCTTSLTLKNATFCPLIEYVYFIRILETRVIILLRSLYWLAFVTETKSVYRAVRRKYLNKFHIKYLTRKERTCIFS